MLAGARLEGIAGDKWDFISEEGGKGLPAPSITAWTEPLLFPNAELLKKHFQKVLARVRVAPAQGGDTGLALPQGWPQTSCGKGLCGFVAILCIFVAILCGFCVNLQWNQQMLIGSAVSKIDTKKKVLKPADKRNKVLK